MKVLCRVTSGAPNDADARFAPPEVAAFAVPRPRLTALLDLATHQRLTIVAAPPGYGKTTLLAEWAAGRPRRRVRWLRVEPGADGQGAFADDLVAALGVAPAGPADPEAFADEDVSPFVRSVLGALEHLPPTVLVIDDLHELTDQASLDELAALVDHAPQSLRTILATRVDPPRRFYRLGLAETLVELRQDDLALTADETASLVSGIAGIELAPEQVDQLVDRTEGWAAGLQLAALSLDDEDDVAGFVARFAGEERHVADYLTEKVLQRLPPDTRQFLLRTSVLDRLQGSLCDAVTGRSDGRAVLEDLHRQHLFTSRDDGPDGDAGWFRYHPLFRTLLRHHLVDEHPGLEAELLHRAGTWHLERGDLDTAVASFAAAGSWPEVLDIAAGHGSPLRVQGRSGAVARWIASVPAAHRPRAAATDLLEAMARAVGGEPARALELVGAVRASGSTTPGEELAAGFVEAVGLLRLGRPTEAIAAATDAEAVAGSGAVDDDGLPRLLGLTNRVGDVQNGLAVVRGVGLARSRALPEAIDVLSSARDGGPAVWSVARHAALALALAWCGRLGEAEESAQWSRTLLAQLGTGAEPATVDGHLALVEVAMARGDLEGVRSHLAQARRRSRRGRDHLTASVMATQEARLALAEGQPTTGLTLLVARQKRRPTERPALPDAVVAWQRAAESSLFLAAGDLDGAGRALDLAPVETVEVASARVALALERDELDEAGAVLDHWPDGPEPIAGLSRRMWTAVRRHRLGDPGATAAFEAVAADAAGEQHLGLLRTHHVLPLARAAYRAAPTPFLRALVEQAPATTSRGPVKGLVEQLTERERIVLSLLPTRQSNVEIAETLGVSLNTVKTHVKHIYRKLGAADRAEAVAVAERLRLF